MDTFPSPAAFRSAYMAGRAQVVWTHLVGDLETPVSAFMKICEARPYSFLLDSVEGGAVRGRYSFLGLKPDLIWRCRRDKPELNRQARHDQTAFEPDDRPPLDSLRAVVAESRIELPPELPPLTAGLVGYMGYDTVRLVERIPDRNPDPIDVPDGVFLRPTVMVAFDNILHRMTLATPVRPQPGVDANAALALEARALTARVDQEVALKLHREAELKLLHAQMNPHFLQNAFANAIYLIKSSPDKAELAMRKLADLFRGTMNAKSRVWSTVAEERRMIEDYLAVQKVRFEERLSFQIDCPASLDDRRLPSFTLQPLVENAVQHGFRENLGGLSVRVAFEAADGGVAVCVANNGRPLEIPFEDAIREGHALHNINKRLTLLGQEPLNYEFSEGRHLFSFRIKARNGAEIGAAS